MNKNPNDLKSELAQLSSELLYSKLNKNQPTEERNQKIQDIENKISDLKKHAFYYIIEYSKEFYDGDILKTENGKDLFLSFENVEIDKENWHDIILDYPQLMKDMQDFAFAKSLKSIHSISKK